MGRNQYDEIDAYAVEIIRFKARQLAEQAGFTEADQDDLEQELIIDLLRRLPKYDPKRGQRATFIARVVKHKIANLIARQTAGKRDYRRSTCPLDEDDGTAERAERLDQEDYILRIGAEPNPDEDRRVLALDVAAVLETLPPELAELCRRLKQETVTDISRDTGVSRPTLYKSIKKLREIFEDAGLKDYLRKVPTLFVRSR